MNIFGHHRDCKHTLCTAIDPLNTVCTIHKVRELTMTLREPARGPCPGLPGIARARASVSRLAVWDAAGKQGLHLLCSLLHGPKMDDYILIYTQQ